MSKELELITGSVMSPSDLLWAHRYKSGLLRQTCHCGWEGADHAEHQLSRLSEHGYSIVPIDSVIYQRVSETFTDDEGVLRDSQNGDIVSTFDWPTLDSVPVGVTRIASQSGRVAALNQVAGWHWTDGEGFPEQDGYDGPWCVAAEVRP